MKVYSINFNPLVTVTHDLLTYLDARSEVLNWYFLFAGTVMIVSNHNQSFLANIIASKYPAHHFLIAEATAFSVDGRLNNAAWDFIRTPKSSGKWDQVSQGLLGTNNKS